MRTRVSNLQAVAAAVVCLIVLWGHAWGSGVAATVGDGTDDRANIVVIMVDDMGYSDIRCYGGEIRTPHLDGLAERGVRFTQFYNTARCCPTRASLLTGLYPHQAGVGSMVSDQRKPGYRGRLNEKCVTIGEVLQQAGYQTYLAGKWHVTPFSYVSNSGSDEATWPLQRGFDRFFGTLAGGGSLYRPSGLMRGNTLIHAPKTGFYYTDAITDAAVEFIGEADDEEPLFLYVAYTAPHWPLHALPEDIDRYAGVYDDGWDAIRKQRYQRMIEMGLIDASWALTPRDGRVKAWEDVQHKAWRVRCMQVYAAMIDRVDQSVGRIVDSLKTEGRYDNTLIMFLSDNGGCAEVLRGAGNGRTEYIKQSLPEGVELRAGNKPEVMPGGPDTFASYGVGWANASNTPFRLYKKNSHEGGVATPFIMHWPAGIDAAHRGKWRDELGHVIDIMPTCLDAAGVEYPSEYKGRTVLPMEGISQLPTSSADNVAQPDERAIFFEHIGHRGVRRGKWKLVARTGKPWELYDMKRDRTELYDLAGDRPELVEELAGLWEEWAQRAQVR